MSEDLKAILSVGISLVVAILYAIKFYRGGTSRERFIKNAEAKGNVVKAVCIKSKRVWSNDNSDHEIYTRESMKVIYEYTVKGKKYRKKLYFQSPGMVSINYPTTITLYYSEKNPRRAYSKMELNEIGRGCFWTFVVFSISMWILVRIIK